MAKIIKCIEDVDIIYTKPKKQDDGKYFVGMFNKNDEEPSSEVLFQFGPKLCCKTNLSVDSSYIDLQISESSILEAIKEVDDAVLLAAKTNKDVWFPEQGITDSYLDNAIMTSLKSIKKSNIDFSFRTRTSKDMVIFNSSKEQVEHDEVTNTSYIAVILQVAGIWFTKTRFGPTWKTRQIRIFKDQKNTINNYLFEDADDEDFDTDNVFPDE